MKKAIQSALLGGVMAFALAACSSTGTTTDTGTTSGASGTTGTTGSSATGTGTDPSTGIGTATGNGSISPVTTPPAAVSSQIPPTSGQ
ncbi:hypothetical protein [Massilia sp. BSC265]|uniref:hypothetical protein n=1 Tax=Massilia sp. BSC265 TaxID=1549812 RepID=UPI0013790BA9|nr:hypothetical protein [Massilia sp. BSC265]